MKSEFFDLYDGYLSLFMSFWWFLLKFLIIFLIKKN